MERDRPEGQPPWVQTRSQREHLPVIRVALPRQTLALASSMYPAFTVKVRGVDWEQLRNVAVRCFPRSVSHVTFTHEQVPAPPAS